MNRLHEDLKNINLKEMDLYEYFKENFKLFSLYSALNLLEYIYSCSIEKITNLKFYSYLSLNNATEITSITEESEDMIITTSRPCLFDYLPKFYLDQFLDLDESCQTTLNTFLNLFTKRMVYLGYKADKVNYLPNYPTSLTSTILSNFGTFYQYKNKTLFLNYYKTPFILKQSIEYLFDYMVQCQIENNHFRDVPLEASSRILGKNWLGQMTKVCDLTILKVECLNFDLYHELKTHGLPDILQLFPPVQVDIYLRPLQIETGLGKGKLGYGISLVTCHHYLSA